MSFYFTVHNQISHCTQQYTIYMYTFDDDFIEGAVRCFLSCWSCGECDKGTLLFGHHMDVADLTKLVEVVSGN